MAMGMLMASLGTNHFSMPEGEPLSTVPPEPQGMSCSPKEELQGTQTMRVLDHAAAELGLGNYTWLGQWLLKPQYGSPVRACYALPAPTMFLLGLAQ